MLSRRTIRKSGMKTIEASIYMTSKRDQALPSIDTLISMTMTNLFAKEKTKYNSKNSTWLTST